MSFGTKKKKSSSDVSEQTDQQKLEDLFRTELTTGTQTKQLKLDQAAIDKLISDVLGGAGGLAEIFQGEQTAGIFDSSVAAQSAGDLTANLVGELAKITGEEVITQDATSIIEALTQTQASTTGSRRSRGTDTSGEAGFKLLP